MGMSEEMKEWASDEGPAPASDVVVAFSSAVRARQTRPAPLTDGEIVELRTLLVQAKVLVHGCPQARRLLEEG